MRRTESVGYWKLVAELEPELGLDLHHMSSAPRVAGTDDLNQFQIGARTVDPDRLLPEQWELARQMAEVSLDALSGYGQTHLARYPDIDITNAVLSRMLLGGTAPVGETPLTQGTTRGAIFYEVRSVGQKGNGYLANLFERPTIGGPGGGVRRLAVRVGLGRLRRPPVRAERAVRPVMGGQ